MRVISGRCRGTHLMAPEGMNTRPTTDRIKETLFNMIAFDIPECCFLDVFSGSGAMAIESLSRGAKEAVLIEKDVLAIKCIEQNLEKTRLKDTANLMKCDVYEAFSKLGGQNKQFDIIFMDPPYAIGEIDNLLAVIVEKNLLHEEGYIILERSTKTIVNLPESLVLWKEKKYKTTTLSFYKRG